jgi:VCBS repeat-containing protein
MALPTLTATGRNLTFRQAQPKVDLFTNVNVTTDGHNLDRLTFTITNVTNGATESVFVDGTAIALTHNANQVTGSGLSVLVTLNGTTATVTVTTPPAGISVAAFTSLVDGLAYQNTSALPGTARHVVTLTSVSDTNASGDTATISVSSTASPSSVNELISVATDGTQSNGQSGGGTGDAADNRVSADGRYVVFTSSGSTLVAGDTNGAQDIFRRDVWTGTTVRISVSTGGGEGTQNSFTPTISADGRYVAFMTNSSLVAGDNNFATDVYVRDVQSGTTTLVSPGTFSGQGSAQFAQISANGKFVVFSSMADNVVSGDTNGVGDVFVRDLDNATTTRVLAPGNVQPNEHSSLVSISANGQYVFFASAATNLVGSDANGNFDIFRYDRSNGAIVRVSVGNGINGAEANAGSFHYSVSDDGNIVAFASAATNLVANDTNGQPDIFIRNISAGTTTLASTSPDLAGGSNTPSISGDGRYVVYYNTGSGFPSAIYAYDSQTGKSARLGFTQTFSSAGGTAPSISADGTVVAFTGVNPAMIPGDTNGQADVILAPVNFNTAPVNAGLQTRGTDKNTQLSFSSSPITISDPDAGQILTVNLTVGQGSLNASGAGGAGVTGSGTSLTIVGDQAQVNAALATLTYTPSGTAGTVFLNVSTSDNDFVQRTDVDNVRINVTEPVIPPNVVPVNGNTDPRSVAEDGTLLFTSPSLTVTDPDAGQTVTVTLTLGSAVGTLAATVGSSTVTGTSIQISGSVAAVNTSLGTLTFKPNANFNGTVNLSMNTVDDHNPAGSDTDNILLTVTAANDAPVLMDVAVTLNSVNENAGAPSGAVGTLVSSLLDSDQIAGGRDNVSDVDGTTTFGIALTSVDTTNGDWFYAPDGFTWLALPAVSPSNALVLGPDARLYFQPDPKFSGDLTSAITYRAIDNPPVAQTGDDGDTEGEMAPPPPPTFINTTPNGGTTHVSNFEENASLTVVDTSTAPTGTTGSVTTPESTTYVFKEADFGFGDVDLDQFTGVIITTAPATGTLTNNGTQLFGGETVSLDDITAGNLKFEPVAGASGVGYASFTFQVQDDGGGNDTDLSAETLTINVTNVNDVPEAGNPTQTINEDVTYTFKVEDFGFTDTDGTFAGVKVSELPLEGKLFNDGVAVNAGETISEADITAGKFTFVPDLNESGSPYTTFTFQVQDNEGGLDPTPNTFTLNVTPLDDKPSLTGFGPAASYDLAVLAASPQLLDADVILTDPDDNWAGGKVVVSGLLPEDRIAIRDEGAGAQNITVVGSDVYYGATLIGAFTAGAGEPFVVTLNGDATSEAVEALIENLTYDNISGSPTATHTLRLDVIDGAGAALGFAGMSAFGSGNELSDVDVVASAAPDFVDLDGDGALDLVVGNSDGTLSAFRNEGDGTFTELTGADNPFDEVNVGSDSNPTFVDFDRDGDLDAVVGDGTGALHYFENDSGDFEELTGTANPFDGLGLTGQAAPAFIDLEQDGDFDLVVRGESGGVRTFKNEGGSFMELEGMDNPLWQLPGYGGMSPAFVDIDGDGDLDAVIGSSEYGMFALRNDNGAFNPISSPLHFNGNFGSPAFADLNGDGDLDAVLGDAGGDLFSFENVAPARGAPITINIFATPVVTSSAGSASFVEGIDSPSTPVAIDAGLTVSDADDSTLSSATVAITGNFQSGEDLLAFAANSSLYGDIVSTGYVGGVLSLSSPSGTATLTQWEAALRSVTYSNSSNTPNEATRTVTFQVNDGDHNSVAATHDVTVSAQNDSPSAGAANSVTTNEGAASSAVPIGATDPENDSLSYSVKSTAAPAKGTVSFDALAGTFTYTPTGDANGADSFTILINDGHGGTVAEQVVTVTINPVNDAPVVTQQNPVTATEQTATALLPDITISDIELDARNGGAGDYGGSTFLASRSGGANTDDRFTLVDGNGFTVNQANGKLFTTGGLEFGYISDTSSGNVNIAFTSAQTPATTALVNAVIDAFRYTNLSDTPPSSVQIVYGLGDGSPGAGQDSNPASTQGLAFKTVTVNMTAVNDAPVNTVPSSRSGTEDTDMVFSGANAITVADADAGSGNLTVTLTVAHGRLTLAGAPGPGVTGNGTGTLTITGTAAAINTALDGLIYRGNLNYNGTDTLTVTTSDNGNSGGSAETDVDSVAITLAPDGIIHGDSGNNILIGTPNPDIFLLHQGGNDTAYGLGGNDLFIFGAALTSQDAVDGGEGRDQIAIQGNYTGLTALTLGTGVVNVESFVLIPGNNTNFGDPGTNTYSYHVTTVNQNVAAGEVMTFDGAQLRAGENFTFRGAAETDGAFRVVGGLGADDFIGGSQTDVFIFNDGAFGSSDVVNGGAGTARDQLALRGDYFVVFGSGQLTSIESLVLLSGYDIRLQTDYDYTIIMNDNNLLGGSMTIDAAQLREDESFVFFGNNETDGTFRISGGAADDQIIGGQGNDRIRGNGGNDNIYGFLGADELYGGAGDDRFAYDYTAHSSAASSDRIMDFTTGDLIALNTIDANTNTAGDDAFQFIGSAAFTVGTAGQLRAYEVAGQPGRWFVEGDVNGDAQADLVIEVFTTDLQPLDATDFTF